MAHEEAPITTLLDRAGQGDGEASEKVLALVYDELRRLAAAQRARIRPGDTLDTTAVVHEAYLRLVARERVSWNGRQHFYCTAARSMRDILVEEARRKDAQKRGGGWRRVELDVDELAPASAEELITLDLVLQKLERDHPDMFEIVLLRYFTGLSVPEVAEVLGLSLTTVERRWRFCRSWLARELSAD